MHATKKSDYTLDRPKDLENVVREGNHFILYHSLKNIRFSYSQLYEYLVENIYVPESGKSFADVISQMMEVSESTIYRWKTKKDKVKERDAERLSALIDLNLYGKEVFESEEEFRNWLKASNLHLDGRSPIDILDSMSGINYVRHLLDKIEYGAPI